MKAKYLFIAAFALFAMSSCTTIRRSTSTTAGVGTVVCQYPTVADLEVHKKVETTITWGFVPFNLGQPTEQQRLENLTAEVIKANGADVLLEPQVVYTKQPFAERTLTIIGYPASFKNFRKATRDDLEALKVVQPSSRETQIMNLSQPWYKKIVSKFKK